MKNEEIAATRFSEGFQARNDEVARNDKIMGYDGGSAE